VDRCELAKREGTNPHSTETTSRLPVAREWCSTNGLVSPKVIGVPKKTIFGDDSIGITDRRMLTI
jgi:hypothetical protein